MQFWNANDSLQYSQSEQKYLIPIRTSPSLSFSSCSAFMCVLYMQYLCNRFLDWSFKGGFQSFLEARHEGKPTNISHELETHIAFLFLGICNKKRKISSAVYFFLTSLEYYNTNISIPFPFFESGLCILTKLLIYPMHWTSYI